MKKMITLSEYCSSVRDGTHDSPKQVDSGKLLITSKHINNGTIDFSSAYMISNDDFNKINKRSKVDKWDLLMSMIGTVGRLYVVKDNPDYAIKNLALFKIGDEWRAKYLYYYLGSQPVQDYFDAVANGTSQHFVGLGYLRKFRIPDWEGHTLTVIRILNNYDQLIENNNKRIKLLEDMAESLYKEWFVRFRFPGYDEVKNNNGIPPVWNYIKFSEIYDYSRGVSYSTEEIECLEGKNLINLKNILSYGGFRRDGIKKYDGKYKNNQVVKCKDLIMGVTDMTQERRTVGAVALVPNINGIISADLIKLRSKINNVFSYCLFKYGFYSKMISQFGNGANVIHLKPTSIKNQKILIPSDDLINSFVKIVEPTIDEIEKLNSQNDILIQQRDSLLPRLMSGKLSVEGKEVI